MYNTLNHVYDNILSVINKYRCLIREDSDIMIKSNMRDVYIFFFRCNRARLPTNATLSNHLI